jgi:hypothetical protein
MEHEPAARLRLRANLSDSNSKATSDLREFARFCVMREERERANIWWAEGASNKGVLELCDFSLQGVRSRPAQVGDKLVTRDFGQSEGF